LQNWSDLNNTKTVFLFRSIATTNKWIGSISKHISYDKMSMLHRFNVLLYVGSNWARDILAALNVEDTLYNSVNGAASATQSTTTTTVDASVAATTTAPTVSSSTTSVQPPAPELPVRRSECIVVCALTYLTMLKSLAGLHSLILQAVNIIITMHLKTLYVHRTFLICSRVDTYI
jgi:hypothetical protein